MRPVWWVTRDGDLDCLDMYERHYSAYRYADRRERKLFVGPGDKLVLRTERADAVFVWRHFIDDSGQQGLNCAVFRNESEHLSSSLIRQADAIADETWTDRRHYTYVRREAVKEPWVLFPQGWMATLRLHQERTLDLGAHHAMSDGFFSTLTGLTSAEAAERCGVELKRLSDERDAVAHRRSCLPRNDKTGAHELLQVLTRIEGRLKRLRPVVAHYRAEADRKESHSLWCAAVAEIAGQDVLRQCFDWMKAERKRRSVGDL